LRQIGNDVDSEEAAGTEHAGDRLERACQIAFARERLENAVGREDGAESRAGAEGKLANVAANQGQPSLQTRADKALPGASQHFIRAIDPDDPRSGASNRNGDPPRAASEFEDRSVLRGGEPLPERDITPLQRAGVFPVVE